MAIKLDRQSLENKTFLQILSSFGESIFFDGTEITCVATAFDEAVREHADYSNYEGFAGISHGGITIQFSFRIEIAKNDWNFNQNDPVLFRNINYKIVSMNESDVGTYLIYLIED